MKTSAKLFGLATLAGCLYYSDTQLHITNYTVKSAKIPSSFNGYKIVQLSDLHGKSFGEDNCKLLDVVRHIAPNIIVITGDMVNRSDLHFESFLNLAKMLSKKYEVYYIVGNHEQRLSVRNQKALIAHLTALNIKVLDNEKIILTKANDSINLYGLWCDLGYYKNDETTQKHYFSNSVVENTLGACSDGYNILLAHNPLFFTAYANWGANLTLSGHVHGGTIRLPLVGGLLSPERKFFPKYSAGEYQYKGKKMIVSRGMGDFRIGNPPEIPVITLNCSK